MFKDIKPRTRNVARLQKARQSGFINDLTPRGVDDNSAVFHELETPRIHQVKRRGCMRAIHRNHIHPRHHLIETFPIGRLKRCFRLFAQTTTVVIMDLHTKRPCTPRNRLANTPHSQNPESLAAHPRAEKRRWRKAGEATVFDLLQSFGNTARHRHHKRHSHIRRVIRRNTRGIGDKNAPLQGARHVNMVKPCAKVGNQFEPLPSAREQIGVNRVRQGRNKNIRLSHRLGQLFTAHRRIILAQRHIEQFFHSCFNRLRQASRHNNTQASRWHGQAPFAFLFCALLAK